MADILYVMATAQEYGPSLRGRIDPLITGVGLVETTLHLTEALTRRHFAGSMPKFVVSLGSAGSARLPPCSLHQASAVSWRDMDATPLGFARGVVPFLDLPPTLRLGPFIPGLSRATLSSGSDIVSGKAYDAIADDMVDMETYAVARVSRHFGLPLIGLRGISDGDAELGGLADWTRYLAIIDEKLADAVEQLETAVAQGTLTGVDDRS
ncbi:adenosylhomocysteine nucleosidase [Devosia enhydra]|uniref:Adenosylhomocysteine nucleosidase n=1 Tax=Devosia enhydra TaxID=665118 RepID=A0A1K2HWU7_9HYPH|nr:5'-methylthioadenosine/S-adenosylhomocysteine nucleosidase [Devosia enhydra]SFZ83584.1 adenosylhomocysteine nucleosidase [Devosia enhydra]